MTHRTHTGVIRQHDPANAITAHTAFTPRIAQRDLDRARTPGNEIRQLPFPDPEQTLVYVRRIDIVPLDDVQAGYVTRVFGRGGGHESIFGLEQASHDVERGGLPDRLCLWRNQHVFMEVTKGYAKNLPTLSISSPVKGV